MSAQSYWGQGPTYGAIHKQDFTADGTGSQVINLNYDIRDSNELLVSIDHLIMEPGVDFILSKDPVKRITISSARTGSSYICWLETLSTSPSFSKALVTDQVLLSAQPADDDLMGVSDADGSANKSATYLQFISGVNPPVHGDVEGSVLATVIEPDVVTYDKMQDVVAANRVLGAITPGSVIETQVVQDMFEDASVDSTKFDDLTTFVVYDPAGTALYTLHGAGT